jgi:hypothetical protein
MNNTVEPHHLNLNETSRKHIDVIIAGLLNQQTLQHQAEIKTTDLKIQVLVLVSYA